MKKETLNIVLLKESNHLELLVPKNELENASQEPWLKPKKAFPQQADKRTGVVIMDTNDIPQSHMGLKTVKTSYDLILPVGFSNS